MKFKSAYKIWEIQKLNSSKTNLILERVQLNSAVNVYISTVLSTGQRALLIEFTDHALISRQNFKKFKGVEIKPLRWDENKIALSIILLDEELFDVFSLFADDIIHELNNTTTENDAIISINSQIKKWRKLFTSINSGLSIEELMGLFGEIDFIEKMIEKNKYPSNIIEAWKGPDSYIFDFLFEDANKAFEVKTINHDKEEINITNEYQLDGTGLDSVYLFLLKVHLNKHVGISLPKKIENLKKKLDENTMQKVNDKLLQVGFYLDEVHLYEDLFFEVYDISFYDIQKGFPRITPHNKPNKGLKKISYSISLADCMGFKVNFNDIII